MRDTATAPFMGAMLLDRPLHCRGEWQGKYFDPLVSQRCRLVSGRRSTYGAFLSLTVVNFSSLFCKPRTHIFGALDDPARHLHPHCLQLLTRNVRRIGGGLSWRTFRLTLRKIQSRGREHLAKSTAATQRTFHQGLGDLSLVFGIRSKPPLETVVSLATEVKYFHASDCKGFVQ